LRFHRRRGGLPIRTVVLVEPQSRRPVAAFATDTETVGVRRAARRVGVVLVDVTVEAQLIAVRQRVVRRALPPVIVAADVPRSLREQNAVGIAVLVAGHPVVELAALLPPDALAAVARAPAPTPHPHPPPP